MYKQYKEKLKIAVDNFNQLSKYKLNFESIDSKITNFLNNKDDKEKEDHVAYDCENIYKEIVDDIFDEMHKDVVSGKKTNDELKPIISDLRGLVREFINLGIESLENKTDDFKKKAIKSTKSFIDHHDFNFYDKMTYKPIDRDGMNIIFPTLSKGQIKMSNYQISNFSGVVDYNNKLRRENNYTSDTLINNLLEDATNKDNYNKDDRICDYLVKYEALKQKHDSRNFISRFFHFKERSALKVAEQNIREIINKDQHDLPNKDSILSYVSKNIRWSRQMTDFSLFFINDKNIKNYQNEIRKDEKLEIGKNTLNIDDKLIDNELENSKDDLNKSFSEKDDLNISIDSELTK